MKTKAILTAVTLFFLNVSFLQAETPKDPQIVELISMLQSGRCEEALSLADEVEKKYEQLFSETSSDDDWKAVHAAISMKASCYTILKRDEESIAEYERMYERMVKDKGTSSYSVHYGLLILSTLQKVGYKEAGNRLKEKLLTYAGSTKESAIPIMDIKDPINLLKIEDYYTSLLYGEWKKTSQALERVNGKVYDAITIENVSLDQRKIIYFDITEYWQKK